MSADSSSRRPLAVITGASSGIGLELAKQFADHGFDLVVAAEDGELDAATASLRSRGVGVDAVRADLATREGVDELAARVADRPVDALALNAGVGVNGAFVDTDLERHLALVDLNVTGAVHLTRLLLPGMVERGAGRVLFTSSIAAASPGPYLSTYNASKAFVHSFALALRSEVKDAGVTVTTLMPGPTDTEFFDRADMEDTKLGQMKRDDPADVAHAAFEALMAGEDHVVTGLRNKAQVAAAKVTPDTALAAMQGKLTQPGSGS